MLYTLCILTFCSVLAQSAFSVLSPSPCIPRMSSIIEDTVLAWSGSLQYDDFGIWDGKGRGNEGFYLGYVPPAAKVYPWLMFHNPEIFAVWCHKDAYLHYDQGPHPFCDESIFVTATWSFAIPTPACQLKKRTWYQCNVDTIPIPTQISTPYEPTLYETRATSPAALEYPQGISPNTGVCSRTFWAARESLNDFQLPGGATVSFPQDKADRFFNNGGHYRNDTDGVSAIFVRFSINVGYPDAQFRAGHPRIFPEHYCFHRHIDAYLEHTFAYGV